MRRLTPILLQTMQFSTGCPASITFPDQRQLFFPIDDNYKLYELTSPTYTVSDRGGG